MGERHSASACLAKEFRVFGFVGSVILLEELIVVAALERPAHVVRRMRAQRPALEDGADE
jgi:hypothetical protein